MLQSLNRRRLRLLCCKYVCTISQAKHNHERAVAPREEQFIRFKTYGDSTKQPLVVVPGLDGATAFFSDIVPELTLNVRMTMVVEKFLERGERSRHEGGARGAERQPKLEDRSSGLDRRRLRRILMWKPVYVRLQFMPP